MHRFGYDEAIEQRGKLNIHLRGTSNDNNIVQPIYIENLIINVYQDNKSIPDTIRLAFNHENKLDAKLHDKLINSIKHLLKG